jgi:hypothetical protein
VSRMMEEYFTRWVSESGSLNIAQKILEDCKKPNFSIVLYI